MTAKLHFLLLLLVFLVLFQNDNPVLPFMYDELSKVSKRLIVLMYKKEKIDEAKTVSKAMKEDLVEKQKQSNGRVFN